MKKIGFVMLVVMIILLLIVAIIIIIHHNSHANTMFKKIFGVDIPKNTEMKQYYYSASSGYCAFDIVFHDEDYNDVIELFQSYINHKYSNNDDVENCKCNDIAYFSNLPIGKNWFNHEEMRLIEGYLVLMSGKRDQKGGTPRIAIVIDTTGTYHAIIDY